MPPAVVAILLTSLAGLAACGGSGGGPGGSPPLGISVTPSSAQSVDPGQTKQFMATVTNDPSNQGVSWALTQNGSACSPACGTLSPSTTVSGAATTYTAPASVSASIAARVTAAAVASTSTTAAVAVTAVPDPVVSTAVSPPAATIGQPYSYTLAVTGGVAPFTWQVISGALPDGLSLDSSTGVISGMATGKATASRSLAEFLHLGSSTQPLATSASFTVQVTDSGAPPLIASQPLVIAINAAQLAPALAISKSHQGNFAPGQQGAQYTLAVSNDAAAGPTDGTTVTVTETVPSGLTLVSMSGAGWNCGAPAAANTCSRSDVLAAGQSYPGITASVNVSANATSPQVNQAAAAGGGSPAANASDSTVIAAPANSAQVKLAPTAPQITLTHASSVVLDASVTGDPTNSGVTWSLQWVVVVNGAAVTNPCTAAICGTLVQGNPILAAGGTSDWPATYTAPAGGLPPGASLTVTATSISNPTGQSGSASSGIGVTVCNPFDDVLCGNFTFYYQGFDASAIPRPAVAAGNFTATGIPVGTPPDTNVSGIVCGVIDINDAGGVDSPPAHSGNAASCAGSSDPNITSGSYTFDPASFTGTVTLNISSQVGTHTKRTFAFTATSAGVPNQRYPLIAFDAAGNFQGSGFLVPQGPAPSVAFPTVNALSTSYAFTLSGSDNSGAVRSGLAGVFAASNACNITAPAGAATPGGTPAATANRGGVVSSGGLASAAPCTPPDSQTGRGTVTLAYSLDATLVGKMVYYTTGGDHFLLSIDTATPRLGGRMSTYAVPVSPTPAYQIFPCGLNLVTSGSLDCIAYTAGASGPAHTSLMLLNGMTQPAQGTPSASQVSNGVLTGSFSAIQDQVSAGSWTVQGVAVAGSFSFDTGSGIGLLCMHAAPCPASGAGSPPEFTVAGKYLLSRDATVATGILEPQAFNCPAGMSPCGYSGVGVMPIASLPYAAGTGVPPVATAPDLVGSLCFGGTSFRCSASSASGAVTGSALLSLNANNVPPALTAVNGTYSVDTTGFNNNDQATGRGTGMGIGAIAAANSVFIAANNDMIVMQTSPATAPATQPLVELQPMACSDCFKIYAEPVLVAVPVGGTSQTTVTIEPGGPLSGNPAPDSPDVTITLTSLPTGVTGCFAPCTAATAVPNPQTANPVKSANGSVSLLLFAAGNAPTTPFAPQVTFTGTNHVGGKVVAVNALPVSVDVVQ